MAKRKEWTVQVSYFCSAAFYVARRAVWKRKMSLGNCKENMSSSFGAPQERKHFPWPSSGRELKPCDSHINSRSETPTHGGLRAAEILWKINGWIKWRVVRLIKTVTTEYKMTKCLRSHRIYFSLNCRNTSCRSKLRHYSSLSFSRMRVGYWKDSIRIQLGSRNQKLAYSP